MNRKSKRDFDELKSRTERNLQDSKKIQAKIDKLSAAICEEFAIRDEHAKRQQEFRKAPPAT